jgi:hypothetical protein
MFFQAKQQYWYCNGLQDWQRKVEGVNFPFAHVRAATEGLKPSAHCVVHTWPGFMTDPSKQAPLLDASWTSVGAGQLSSMQKKEPTTLFTH